MIKSEIQKDSFVNDESDGKVHWDHDDVLLLVTKVGEYWDQFSKGMKKKKFIWGEIASQISRPADNFIVKSFDCDRKWRNLKVRYMAVLEKQTQGERASHRIDYFDKMHAFLKDDPDTQVLLKNRQTNQSRLFTSTTAKGEKEDYADMILDGSVEWNGNAVKMLLDLLIEFKDWFKDQDEHHDDETIWEALSEQMMVEGFEADPEQCRRKWQNLESGFQHHKAQAEATGTLPLWPFYTRVRHVLSVIGHLSDNDKSTAVKRPIKSRGRPKGKKAKIIKQEVDVPATDSFEETIHEIPDATDTAVIPGTTSGSKSTKPQASITAGEVQEICQRLERVEEHLALSRRLDQLETRMLEMNQQQEGQEKTNALLSQVTSELSRLSRTLMNRFGGQDATHLSSGITIVVPHSQDL